MADSLYLSLWFPSFTADEVLPRTLAVLQQIPYSTKHPGVEEIAVHAISWSEPLLFQQDFTDATTPEHATQSAAEFVADDSAIVFDTFWDLWTPSGGYDQWTLSPRALRVIAYGDGFDDGVSEERGHIEIDFGLDSPFLGEEEGPGISLTEIGEEKVRENVARLVAFTNAVEIHCGVRARLLWSESDANLVQKLIARLQKVQ